MNFAAYIEEFFAKLPSAQLEEVLQKLDFDRLNAAGSLILSPEEAMAEAARMRNTFSTPLNPASAGNADCGWSPSKESQPVSAGNYEEMPLAA